MSTTRTLLLAGIASVGLASTAFSQSVHEEIVQLGPNAVEHIYYTGDAAPQVSVAPAQPADAMLVAMQEQQAAMAAQMQQMLQQAQALMNAPMAEMPALDAADAAGACVTSMSFTQIAGQQPKVTEYRSPGCGEAAQAPVQPTELKPAYSPAAPTPKLIQARLTPPDQTSSG